MSSKTSKFPKNFWVAITMEFFERGAYYGMMSVLSVFLVLECGNGGMGFSKEQSGVILGTIQPLLYFLPIIAGAVADKLGYRKVLYFAFSCMIVGYGLTGLFSDTLSGTRGSYYIIFSTLLIMAVGAGFFKPIISGTVAKTTDQSNSGLGFGIFYWSINLGSFLFPLILVPILKAQSYSYIFYACSLTALILFLINTFLFSEPRDLNTAEEEKKKEESPLAAVLNNMVLVLKDWRFLLMVLLYSGFWILYFQMYGSILWYFNDFMDMAPVDRAVNSFLSLFVDNPDWHFDVEHITVLNSGIIITLQLIVSKIVEKAPALPTMITGIGFGVLGMVILSFSVDPWMFILGMATFSFGEMTAHPKFNSYIGIISPSDKKAIYMGYSFLYAVIGSSIGGLLGPVLYVKYVEEMGSPLTFFLIFASMGVFSMIALGLYNHFIAKKMQR